MKSNKLAASFEILQTSEQGDIVSKKASASFCRGQAETNVIKINPEIRKQVLSGVGVSFTESSAFVLAHLAPDSRREVMSTIFSDAGSNFSSKVPTICCTLSARIRVKFSRATSAIPGSPSIEMNFASDAPRD